MACCWRLSGKIGTVHVINNITSSQCGTVLFIYMELHLLPLIDAITDNTIAKVDDTACNLEVGGQIAALKN